VVHRAIVSWYEELYSSVVAAVVSGEARPIREELERLLTPLVRGGFSKLVVVECDGEWSCVFNNAYLGTDTSSLDEIARRIGVKYVSVMLSEDVRTRAGVLWHGARQFCLVDYSASSRPVVRTISVMNDGSRWRFYQEGDPLPQEDPAWVLGPRIADRFSENALVLLADSVGVRLLSESFYKRVFSQVRIHVQSEEIDLHSARRQFGFEH